MVSDYFSTNISEWTNLVMQHIEISFYSVLIAVIISLPLGILISTRPKIYDIFTNFFSFLRIIPSLAVLFVCIPIFGVGVFPAVIALTFLAIPPLLLNIATGFQNIDEAIIETAIGMGMSKQYMFFKVRLPLAMPLILTGIRTATVEVIASATLAAYIGAGGLGEIIITGLGLYRMDLLLIGGISVAILSLTADISLSLVSSYLTKYQRTLD